MRRTSISEIESTRKNDDQKRYQKSSETKRSWEGSWTEEKVADQRDKQDLSGSHDNLFGALTQ
jgi:hypothetical protein